MKTTAEEQIPKKDRHKWKHGMNKSPEWTSWSHMKERCYSPSATSYENYGGRGIKVCDRWLDSFENFYADLGPKPSAAHSLDRKDGDGNYTPENCRWATKKQQSRNLRTNFKVNGVPLADLLEQIGSAIPLDVAKKRIAYGWDPGLAISTPARKNKPRANPDKCKFGHSLTGTNARIDSSTGRTRCRKCARVNRDDHYQRTGK